jgi:hypothetical protein
MNCLSRLRSPALGVGRKRQRTCDEATANIAVGSGSGWARL